MKLRMNDERCPACGASLRGSPIPVNQQESYGASHFSRKIGIYSVESDRTVAWRCPDCGGEWPR